MVVHISRKPSNMKARMYFSGTARSSLPQLEEDVWALERPRRWSCWGWEKPLPGRQDAKKETKPGPVLCGLRKRTAPDAQIAKSRPFLSGDMHSERKFDAPFERFQEADQEEARILGAPRADHLPNAYKKPPLLTNIIPFDLFVIFLTPLLPHQNPYHRSFLSLSPPSQYIFLLPTSPARVSAIQTQLLFSSLLFLGLPSSVKRLPLARCRRPWIEINTKHSLSSSSGGLRSHKV